MRDKALPFSTKKGGQDNTFEQIIQFYREGKLYFSQKIPEFEYPG